MVLADAFSFFKVGDEPTRKPALTKTTLKTKQLCITHSSGSNRTTFMALWSLDLFITSLWVFSLRLKIAGPTISYINGFFTFW